MRVPRGYILGGVVIGGGEARCGFRLACDASVVFWRWDVGEGVFLKLYVTAFVTPITVTRCPRLARRTGRTCRGVVDRRHHHSSRT